MRHTQYSAGLEGRMTCEHSLGVFQLNEQVSEKSVRMLSEQ